MQKFCFKKFIFCLLNFLFLHQILQGNPKILFVLNKFPRITETFILSQITGLIDKGCDISIWACQTDETDIVHPNVIKYQLLDKLQYVDYHDTSSQKCMRQLVHDFDIIYCQYDWIGTVLAKIKSKTKFKGKLVVCIRGGPLDSRIKKNPQGYKILFALTDLFLPVCHFFKNNLIDLGVKKERIIVHHSAIDCYAISYKQRYCSGQTINILTIARLIRSKGLDFGIKAIARLCEKYPNIQYTIIGGGKLHAYLQRLIHKLRMNRNIRLLGWRSHKKIIKYLYKSHILLHPSICSEGIPNAIMEGMASGLPVVSTKVNGISEIVDHGNSGFIVSPNNALALGEKVEYLITHPELWNVMGKIGRDYVEKEHNIIVENNKLIDIFESLLSNNT